MKPLLFAFICVLILGFSASAKAQQVDMGIFSTALKQLQKTVSVKPNLTAKKTTTARTRTTATKPANTRTATTAKNTRTPKNTTVARNPTRNENPTTEVEPNIEESTEETTEETTVTANVPLVDTTYKPAQGMILIDKLFAQANANDPQINLYKGIIVQGWMDYQTASQTRGYQYNDLARALSFFIGTNYNVYHKSQRISPEQVRGLYNQMKQNFGTNPELAKMKDEDKQLFCELLVFLATVPMYANAVGTEQGNAQLVQQSRDMAKQNLETLLGMSVDKIAFNDEGLMQQ